MAVFKCKMCGGALEINSESGVAVCEYCGSVQTLPKRNDEVIANLFNRANNLRIKCEFDKAAQVYEKILNEDNSDAEAHWGLLLCKYGIEYVEDPKTYKRIPTCHRTQYESVLSDVDYLSALANSDGEAKNVYKAQAEEISELQKNILAIVKNEKPFDVFICYKETDENGKRTVDSALANDIYYQLTQEGLKVFYAAITLEDKLGQEYEPYIFAALNSAKVMLVVGTKPDYFDSVWVRNEWSRYLKLMKTDRSRLLIPCYRDMDAYDLPEEFAHLQAQDMSKIGFVNDVVRGIKKVVEQPNDKESGNETAVKSSGSNTASLLERAFMFLEDGDWQSADEYCEKVLDIEPKNATAYLGKLMAELQVSKQEQLGNQQDEFTGSINYQKACRFADNELKSALDDYAKNVIYLKAQRIMEKYTVDDYNSAISTFETIKGWKDSNEKIAQCKRRIEEIKVKQEAERLERERRIEEAKIEAEKRKKLIKKNVAIATPIAAVLVAFVIVLTTVIIPSKKYNEAIQMIDSGEYEAAYALLNGLNYKDSDEKLESITPQYYKSFIQKNAIRESVSAGLDHTVGLKSDGTVVAVGANIINQCDVEGWTDIVAVSAGSSQTVGLKADGTVVAVGYDNDGRCDVEDWTDIVSISAGWDYTVGLKADGTVVAVGDNRFNKCHVEDWIGIVAVSAGSSHTVGLKADGTVVAVGSNGFNQCDVEDWTDIVAVSAGSAQTVGLKSDGTIVAVGSNNDGQCDVEDWIGIVAVSAGSSHTVGLKADGTVVAVGENDDNQCDIEDWTDIVAVSAGIDHTVGLKADGSVVAVGDNYYNQCDVEDWNNIKTPKR